MLAIFFDDFVKISFFETNVQVPAVISNVQVMDRH